MLSQAVAEFPTGDGQMDIWTIDDILKGVMVFGGTGSGKTSGSGRYLAESFLELGFGGLVLTVKTDEADAWRKYARVTGRDNDLIVIEENSGHYFNFLDYEASRGGKGAAMTDNIYRIFSEIKELITDNKQTGGDPHWANSAEKMFKSAVDILLFSRKHLTVDEIQMIVNAAPVSLKKAKKLANDSNNFLNLCLEHALKMMNKNPQLAKSQAAKDVARARIYFLEQYPRMADNERSGVVSTFNTFLDPLLRGLTYKLLCSGTNIKPDDSFNGKIIVLNLPVNTYQKAGKVVQIVWKYMWQQAVLRRTIGATSRPVFLWADEAQQLITKSDRSFLNVERGLRATTVYLTQNIHNLYDELEKSNADALLAAFQNFIFHANNDHTTNEWAANKIAKVWTDSTSINLAGQTNTAGVNIGETIRFRVEPDVFAGLSNGGPRNNYLVGAIVLRASEPWLDTKGFHRWVGFNQL